MANPIEATPDLDAEDWARLMSDLRKVEPMSEEDKRARLALVKAARAEFMRPKTKQHI